MIRFVKAERNGKDITYWGRTDNTEETLTVYWMGDNHMNRKWRKRKLLTTQAIGKWVKVKHYLYIISKSFNQRYQLYSYIL